MRAFWLGLVLVCTFWIIPIVSGQVELKVRDFKMTIKGEEEKDEIEIFEYPQVSPANKAPKTFQEGDELEFSFSLTRADGGGALDAQQVFLSFSHPKLSSSDLVFVFSPNANDKSSYSLSVPSSSFKGFAGVYNMELIVGDVKIKPILWKLGSVQLIAPAYHIEPKMYDKLPEINHIFRSPDPRPSAVTSWIFTVLVLLPLFALFYTWSSLGVNFKNFGTGGGITGLLFHLTLGLNLAIIVYGWLYLNMFQVLGYMAIVSVASIFFGKLTLSNLAQQAQKK